MIARIAVVALALAAAVVPLPAEIVERHYSRGVYLLMQPVLTSTSNVVPIAVIDGLAVVVLAVGAAALVRRVRRDGARSAIRRTARSAVVLAAAAYLVFLATWGVNYQRVPLEQKIDYEEARVTTEGAIRFATIVVEQTNTHDPGDRTRRIDLQALESAFVETQQLLGSTRFAEPGRPKRSLLQPYFRWTAISGMTVPGPLEIILNPDLLPVETPFTLAHEWAHLAGYADESEANFFAWLTCVRSSDAFIRYSGWLESYGLAVQGVPREARSSLPRLNDGPRADLRAINERLARSSPRARRMARGAYDSYLRAHRVEEGIRSYDAALRVILGTRFEDGWTPVRR